MAIDYKLNKLVIKNFRGIANLEVELRTSIAGSRNLILSPSRPRTIFTASRAAALTNPVPKTL